MKKDAHLFFGLLVLIALIGGFWKLIQHRPTRGFQVNEPQPPIAQKPRFEADFTSSKLHTSTHAGSLVQLQDGGLRAFWFSGSREGARDVEIRSAVFDSKNNKWSAEQVVATRLETEKSLLRYVSKLGNPICGRSPDGTLWLYYVTVSFGGWSGSSITGKTSTDDGKTWSKARRIVTSPFMNVSTLVKGTPFLYRDGTMGIPVYRELNNKFGEILHLDRAGKVLDLQRLSAGTNYGLQPVMLIKSADEAQVLMRNSGPKDPRHVISLTTQDGGQNWTKPTKLSLFNPDSALSAVVLVDGRILAVVNNQVNGRAALEMVISADGGASWKSVYRLEDQLASQEKGLNAADYFKVTHKLALNSDSKLTPKMANAYADSAQKVACGNGSCRFEFSYPYLIQTANGDFHLVYTWNRSFIKHVWFNQAWIDQRLNNSKS